MMERVKNEKKRPTWGKNETNKQLLDFFHEKWKKSKTYEMMKKGQVMIKKGLSKRKIKEMNSGFFFMKMGKCRKIVKKVENGKQFQDFVSGKKKLSKNMKSLKNMKNDEERVT
jgi:hypothetical protein